MIAQPNDQDQRLLYASHEEAEQAIHVLMAVLPSLIVDVANDIHRDWLDGQPKLQTTEADLLAKVERIVREKFPS